MGGFLASICVLNYNSIKYLKDTLYFITKVYNLCTNNKIGHQVEI